MDPNFSFPFPPYDIQKQFMRELYFTIENKKLGIFESPTGTVSKLRILPDFMIINDGNWNIHFATFSSVCATQLQTAVKFHRCIYVDIASFCLCCRANL